MASLEEQVGAQVRHHRKLADLTQAQLAERINRQTGAITRIETGESAPSFETLAGLAVALGVEVRDFFGSGAFAAAEGRDDPLVGIIEKLTRLSEVELRTIDELVGVALKLRRST
jgi:transcriptional regulator with XRE-family HTH domain